MANLQEIIGLTKSQFNTLVRNGSVQINGETIEYSEDILYLIQPDATDDVSIASIEQTTASNADGGTNVITVTLTNGNTSTFTVKNGSKGTAGVNGTSVTVENVSTSTVDGGSNVVTFSDGKAVTIKNGTKGTKGDNGVGIASITKTSTNGRVDTYTISLTNGVTQQFTVTNGKDGEKGTTPVKGTDYFTDADIATIATQAAGQVDVSGKVSAHNTNTSSHSDIRLLISNLTTKLNTLANSTDEDLDQLSEIVAYIKANKGLIDGITTSKVNVADIIDNLTTSVTNMPLSANQGVELKKLIDALRTYVDDEFAKLIPITRYW